jgi:hypothetical protein
MNYCGPQPIKNDELKIFLLFFFLGEILILSAKIEMEFGK